MSKRPSKQQLDQALDDAEAVGRAMRAAPTWADIRHAFPDVQIKDHPDGSRTARIEDFSPEKKRLRKLSEMLNPKRRIEAEQGQKRNARHQEIQMKDPSGHVRYVREEHEERVAKKLGSRRVRRGRPSYSVWFDRNGDKWVKIGNGDWEMANA